MKKIVIITGASSGIGLELKRLYEKQGDIVVNLSRNCVENETNFRVDVSNRNLVFVTFEKIYEKYKKIDTLINCAGFGVFGAVELTSEQKARNIFDVNYFGTLWCCQAGLRYMKKGSRIINISSACALYSLPYRSMYSASKSAVNMLSYGMRMELNNYGIDVTCVCPGDIKTNFSTNREVELITNEKYNEKISNSFNKIAEREHLRMPIEKAVRKIFKICLKKKTKPMYIISGKYNILNVFTRFVSTNTILNITNKMF